MGDRRIVLITGGNAGIGYEAVKAFLQSDRSYHILMGSRSIEKANAAIEQLKSEVPGSPSTVDVVQVDIAEDQSIEKAFAQVQASHGHIDALINNAGRCCLDYNLGFLLMDLKVARTIGSRRRELSRYERHGTKLTTSMYRGLIS